MARVANSLFRTIWFASLVFAVPAGAAFAQSGNLANTGVAGVDIDADNVLRVRETDVRLRKMQLQAALKANRGQVKTSPMRKVSLNRYEKAVANAVETGSGFDQMIASVAGLTRIEYVIYLPGSKDIVFAGPAEEIIIDSDGRPVGMKSGSPALRLDDLVVALRAFRPGSNGPAFINCSIDPTQEGLAGMQAYLNQFGGNLPANLNGDAYALGMKQALGMQNVSIDGIPASTRFAQTLVEADYRMKLIGIGLEQPPVRMRSWVERASPTSKANSSLQRWFFVADYESVKVSPDGMVLQLSGQGVKLIGESERVDREGNRKASGKAGDPASQGYTQDFTAKFDEIAASTPVFYEMRNLFDLTVAAAYVRSQDMYTAAGWDLGIFGREDALPVEVASVPKQVETAVNAIWKGNRLMTPIGGGVQISTRDVLTDDMLEESSELATTQENASAPADLAANQWWWD